MQKSHFEWLGNFQIIFIWGDGMRRVVFGIGAVLALVASSPVYADSFIRVKCDDKDEGAQVFLNGRLVGACPVDVPAPAGTVQLQARKIVNKDYEQLFSKQLQVIDGVPQRVELIMSAPQLTAEARRRNEVAEAGKQLRAAESGDVPAMQKIAGYYEAGFGVEKSPAQAQFWRGKAEVTMAQEQLRAANAGDIEAMSAVAARYDAGLGVNRDFQQAAAWRGKAEAAKREKAMRDEQARLAQLQREKAEEKQRRIDQFSYFPNTHRMVNGTKINNNNVTAILSTGVPIMLTGFSFDASSSPIRTTEKRKIMNEAALRPSTWGNPESMIARATLQYKQRMAEAENTELQAAAR